MPLLPAAPLLLAGALVLWRLVRDPSRASPRGESKGGAFRAGPWPGLTPRGAGVLLGCALLLAGGQFSLGGPSRPWPDEALVAWAALVPLVLATRVVRAPGTASAVCGAYLLPAALVSLVDPSVPPPPLLLVPALVFDITLWLMPSDVAGLRPAWPGHRRAWRRRRPRGTRQPGGARGAISGALFGTVLAAIEPPYAVLLGADPSTWSGAGVWAGAAASAAGGGMIGLALTLRELSDRDTGS